MDDTVCKHLSSATFATASSTLAAVAGYTSCAAVLSTASVSRDGAGGAAAVRAAASAAFRSSSAANRDTCAFSAASASSGPYVAVKNPPRPVSRPTSHCAVPSVRPPARAGARPALLSPPPLGPHLPLRL